MKRILTFTLMLGFSFNKNLAVGVKSKPRRFKKAKQSLLKRRCNAELKIITQKQEIDLKNTMKNRLNIIKLDLENFKTQLEEVKDLLDRAKIEDQKKAELRFYLIIFEKELNQLSYLLGKNSRQLESNNKLCKTNFKRINEKMQEVDQIFEDYITSLKQKLIC